MTEISAPGTVSSEKFAGREVKNSREPIITAVADTLKWWAEAENRTTTKNSHIGVDVSHAITQKAYFNTNFLKQDGYKTQSTDGSNLMVRANADGLLDFLNKEISTTPDGERKEQMLQAKVVLEKNSQAVVLKGKRRKAMVEMYAKEYAFARSGKFELTADDVKKAEALILTRREFVWPDKLPTRMPIEQTMLQEKNLPPFDENDRGKIYPLRLPQSQPKFMMSPIERTRKEIEEAKRIDEITKQFSAARKLDSAEIKDRIDVSTKQNEQIPDVPSKKAA